MTLTLRYMTLKDIPQVVAIDRVSFDPPWSAHSYAYEIEQSTYSHMVVLEHSYADNSPPKQNWWDKLKGHFSAENGTNGTRMRRDILAYGGLWKIMDEAHISTIATHLDWRGHSYGEVVLAGMISRAMNLSAEYVVLEVRVSNTIAQNLYKKYEFEIFDTKPNYYRSDNEDAYDMRLKFDNGYKQRFQKRYDAIKARLQFTDEYTERVKA